MDRFCGSPGSQPERVLNRLLSWRDEAREKGISGLPLLNGSYISARDHKRFRRFAWCRLPPTR